MSAVELNKQVIEQLSAGNTVTPQEMLKDQLVGILEALDQNDNGEHQMNLGNALDVVEGISDELEGFLAVAVPLIEYGGEGGQEAVVSALARIAQQIDRRPPDCENALYLLAARLLWCTTAFALACDTVDFLPRLLRLSTRSHFHGRDERLVDDSSVRHLSAFDRGAGDAFESHQQWITSSALVQRCYPLLARDGLIEEGLMEADMLFALHSDATESSLRGTYSHGAHRTGRPEARLRARLGAPAQREQLSLFFGVPDGQLEQRLAELHEGLPRDREEFMGDVRLFPGEQ